MWKDILKGLYTLGEVDATRLENAVAKGLITEDDKNEIIKGV